MKLILASASPRRHELMKIITEDFEIVTADVVEIIPENIRTDHVSMYLAELKAKAVSKLYPEDIVIGCDTVVIISDKILGKPSNEKQCRDYLKMLSGRQHTVSTGISIKCSKCNMLFQCCTYVTFRELSEQDIDRYISTGEPFDKAGGYGIQGKGALLVDKIEGDYYNVVGLPVSCLNQRLKEFREILNRKGINYEF